MKNGNVGSLRLLRIMINTMINTMTRIMTRIGFPPTTWPERSPKMKSFCYSTDL